MKQELTFDQHDFEAMIVEALRKRGLAVAPGTEIRWPGQEGWAQVETVFLSDLPEEEQPRPATIVEKVEAVQEVVKRGRATIADVKRLFDAGAPTNEKGPIRSRLAGEHDDRPY